MPFASRIRQRRGMFRSMCTPPAFPACCSSLHLFACKSMPSDPDTLCSAACHCKLYAMLQLIAILDSRSFASRSRD